MAELPEGTSITISTGRNAGKRATLTQAAIDSVRAEAYAGGHRDGQLEILTELERARAFTTMQARRTLWRIRQRLDAPATLDTP